MGILAKSPLLWYCHVSAWVLLCCWDQWLYSISAAPASQYYSQWPSRLSTDFQEACLAMETLRWVELVMGWAGRATQAVAGARVRALALLWASDSMITLSSFTH